MGRVINFYGSREQVKYFDHLLKDEVFPLLNKIQWNDDEMEYLEYLSLNPDVNYIGIGELD